MALQTQKRHLGTSGWIGSSSLVEWNGYFLPVNGTREAGLLGKLHFIAQTGKIPYFSHLLTHALARALRSVTGTPEVSSDEELRVCFEAALHRGGNVQGQENGVSTGEGRPTSRM